MAKTNLSKNMTIAESLEGAEVDAPPDLEEDSDAVPVAQDEAPLPIAAPNVPVGSAPVESAPVEAGQDIDELINALKSLLSAVEKLQKVRQEVGDIKPLILRMLDGEIMAGEELEQLKTGVAGLFRLTRAYTDHQMALSKAQPARTFLDEVLKVRDTQRSL
jgi:hypothetical protein